MKAFLRGVCFFLCLTLVAKGSVAAALSITGASGYQHPVADACPLAGLASFAGTHQDAVAANAEQPTTPGSAGDTSPLHHHHSCLPLCLMQSVAPEPMAMPVGCPTSIPVLALPVFTPVISSPPTHPPRDRG